MKEIDDIIWKYKDIMFNRVVVTQKVHRDFIGMLTALKWMDSVAFCKAKEDRRFILLWYFRL